LCLQPVNLTTLAEDPDHTGLRIAQSGVGFQMDTAKAIDLGTPDREVDFRRRLAQARYIKHGCHPQRPQCCGRNQHQYYEGKRGLAPLPLCDESVTTLKSIWI